MSSEITGSKFYGFLSTVCFIFLVICIFNKEIEKGAFWALLYLIVKINNKMIFLDKKLNQLCILTGNVLLTDKIITMEEAANMGEKS